MRFNIKEWQEKYLISEAKLRELEFADQKGFKRYSSKHKVNPSTKVTIGGKQTSAGEASEDEEEVTIYNYKEKSVAPSTSGKSLKDKIESTLYTDASSDNFDEGDYENEALHQLDQLFTAKKLYDKEELTYEDGVRAIQKLKNYQDGSIVDKNGNPISRYGLYDDEDTAHDAKQEMQNQLMNLFDPDNNIRFPGQSRYEDDWEDLGDI
jgi:hypothetical protein